jgi:diguanylate cyclase (GGDEF)-like protein/PAS domain S-box-containing protein
MAHAWTQSELIEWAGDDIVVCFDTRTHALPVPDWLQGPHSPVEDHSVGQRLAAADPHDRQRMIDMWWDVMRHPAEEYEIELVVRGERGWSRVLARFINLEEQPDVGAVVSTIRFLEQVEAATLPPVEQSGEFEAVDLLIHELDETGVILQTEGKVYEITGRRPDEVIGQSVLDHIHPDGFDDAIKVWLEVMAGPPGTTRTGRQRVVRPDGTTIWIESTTIKREAPDGTVTCTIICHDLTERRKQESALRASQLEFRLLADQVPGAVFRANSQQRVTFRNDRWDELLGEEGPSVQNLYDIVYEDDRPMFDDEMRRLVSGPSQSTAAFEVRSGDGERVFAITCRSVLDLVNESRSFVGAVTDITATVRLRERADHDALTGLRNRASVEERLEQALIEHRDEVVVVFVDLDGFKEVNDTYGHAVGDRMLVEVAKRLRDSVRPDDVVGRFGGDEFVLVLQTTELDDQSIVDRLEATVARPIIWAGGSWRPTVSLGLARPAPGEDIATIVRRADRAMFAVKRQRKLRLA